MKKNLLYTFVMLLAFATARGQYRCIPHLIAHGNPGNSTLNDISNGYPSLGVGYSAIPVWSEVKPMSFPFLFNGQSVTHFKVSSTGVVTFDTLAVTVPPAGAVVLPNAQIPDKSVCITGIDASYYSSANNQSQTNTYTEWVYGDSSTSARQWIFFVYYSDTIVSNYNSTVAWAIVFEEGTNNIYIVDQFNGTSSSVQVSLGIQVDASTAYMVQGSPNIPSLAGSTFNESDNYYYGFYPGNSLTTDGNLVSTSFQNYMQITDGPFPIAVQLENLGTDTIQSITLHYQFSGSAAQYETFSGLNIPIGNGQSFTFSNAWNPPSIGPYILDIAIDTINGNTDLDQSNNALQRQTYVAQTLPPRRGLYEAFKGTWCLHCGYWTVKFDSLLALNTLKGSSIKQQQDGNLVWSLSDVYTRTDFNNVTSYPSVYANGVVANSSQTGLYVGCPWHVTQSMIDSLFDLNGLFYIQPQATVIGYTVNLSSSITSAIDFPAGSHCSIYVSILEDTIIVPPQGSSGESLFVRTSKKMFPDANGTYIGAPVFGQVDSVNYTFQVTDTLTSLSGLRILVWVQDTITKEVFQTAEADAVINCLPTYSSYTYDLCSGDSVNILGTWISASGNYPSLYTGANGCDSMRMNVVKVHSITTLVSANSTSIYVYGFGIAGDIITFQWYDASNNQFIPGASGTFYSGLQFSPVQSGMYSILLTNQFGCSVMTDVINFNCTPSDTQQTISLCTGQGVLIGNHWYVFPGTYLDSLISTTGCDSIVTSTISIQAVDTSLQINNYTITAVSGYDNYSWINCDNGQVVGSGVSFTATTTGNYQVIISDSSNGCIVASSCVPILFTGIHPLTDEIGITIANLSNGNFIVTVSDPKFKNAEINIYNITGEKISTSAMNGQTTIDLHNQCNGVYFVQLKTEKEIVNKKVIINK